MSEISVEVSWGHVRALATNSFQANTLLVSGMAKLCGWSLRETSGVAPAFAEFTSGNSSVGEPAMPSGQNDSHDIANGGVVCPQGITLAVTGGAFTGCIYYQAPRA